MIYGTRGGSPQAGWLPRRGPVTTPMVTASICGSQKAAGGPGFSTISAPGDIGRWDSTALQRCRCRSHVRRRPPSAGNLPPGSIPFAPPCLSPPPTARTFGTGGTGVFGFCRPADVGHAGDSTCRCRSSSASTAVDLASTQRRCPIQSPERCDLRRVGEESGDPLRTRPSRGYLA